MRRSARPHRLPSCSRRCSTRRPTGGAKAAEGQGRAVKRQRKVKEGQGRTGRPAAASSATFSIAATQPAASLPKSLDGMLNCRNGVHCDRHSAFLRQRTQQKRWCVGRLDGLIISLVRSQQRFVSVAGREKIRPRSTMETQRKAEKGRLWRTHVHPVHQLEDDVLGSVRTAGLPRPDAPRALRREGSRPERAAERSTKGSGRPGKGRPGGGQGKAAEGSGKLTKGRPGGGRREGLFERDREAFPSCVQENCRRSPGQHSSID